MIINYIHIILRSLEKPLGVLKKRRAGKRERAAARKSSKSAAEYKKKVYIWKWCEEVATPDNAVHSPATATPEPQPPSLDDIIFPDDDGDSIMDFVTPPSSPIVSPLNDDQVNYIKDSLESFSMSELEEETVTTQDQLTEADYQWCLALDAKLYDVDDLLEGDIADVEDGKEDNLLGL